MWEGILGKHYEKSCVYTMIHIIVKSLKKCLYKLQALLLISYGHMTYIKDK